MVVKRDALVTDFLAGKDQVSPMLHRILNAAKPLSEGGFLGTGISDVTPKMKAMGLASQRLLDSVSAMPAPIDKAEVSMAAFTKAGQLGAFAGRMKALGITTQDIIKPAGDLGKAYQASFNQASKAASAFDMRMLSVLFFGMQLQRTFGGALASLKDTFLKVDGLQTGLSKGVTSLSASWEFLKFSIFNALDQPIFLSMIDFLVNAINWVSNLINKYPALGVAIIGAFAALAATGTVMVIIGQFSLAYIAIFGLGGIIPGAMATSTAATVTFEAATVSAQAAGAKGKWAPMLGGLAGVAAGIWLAWEALQAFRDLVDSFTEDSGAPEAEDIFPGLVNPEDLNNTTQEFSNLRAGMASTIEGLTLFNPATETFNSTVSTQQTAIQGVIDVGTNWLEQNLDLRLDLSESAAQVGLETDMIIANNVALEANLRLREQLSGSIRQSSFNEFESSVVG